MTKILTFVTDPLILIFIARLHKAGQVMLES